MASTAVVITILVVLGLLTAGAFVWMILELAQKNNCEKNESIFCPSQTCPDSLVSSKTGCGIRPYRFDTNGNIVCMPYLTEDVLPKYD